MNSQKQTDSRLSSRDHRKSNKKLVQIRIHIKTQKPNKIVHKSKHRNSFSRDQPLINKDSEEKKADHSSKSIRQNSSASAWSATTMPKWSNSRPSDAIYLKAVLPQIIQYRGGSEWVSKTSSKKSMPGRSIKIPFKELIPIKQISKEDKVQNLRKIRDEFRELVNTSNNILVKNTQSVFRAYVQKGNNGILVKELLKKRWWWHLQQNSSKANLFWTEWFNSRYTNDMPQIKIGESINQQIFNGRRSSQIQPKVQSIRMIIDQQTFTKIKPRISLRQDHYLRNHNKSLQIRQNNIQDIKQITPLNNIMHNHIDGCLQLHSKKLLFKNFYSYLKKKNWNPFEYIPITYYIQNQQNSAIRQILQHYDIIQSMKQQNNLHNLWIVKPGQCSNRGYGITVHSNRIQLQNQLNKRLQDSKRSIIVQKYIQDCFLVYGRKFDIRCYILITTVNGSLKGYWYHDGYIRTSSQEFTLDDCSNRMIHLTNDAVQKTNQSYGKYQDFNKMSFANFKKYICKMGFQSSKFDESYSKMKQIAYYLIASTSSKIKRKQYTFQLFGLDFMLNNKLKPFLIQANSNPCLETSGVILGKLIPQLVDNVLMTAIDPLFPPPNKIKTKQYLSKDYFRSNKFELIFNDNQADIKQNYISTQN